MESDREYPCKNCKKKARKRNERGKKYRVYEPAEPAQPDDGSGAETEGQAFASDGRGSGSDVGGCRDRDRGTLGTALGGKEDGKRN